MPQVAPYSGDMLAMVARSASARLAKPGPKYSTNLPTTPCLRSISVTVRTRSVAVEPSRNWFFKRTPTTCGISQRLAGFAIGADEDHTRQVLEIDLVNDAGIGRHDGEVLECGLSPAQE